MNKVLKKILAVLVYLLGLSIIAIGINISKLSGLGISPVSSIPGVLSKAVNVSLGSMVIAVYCVLVLAQVLVLRKKFRPINILGIPVAIIFGLLVDFLGIAKFTPTLAGIKIGITKEFTGLLYFLNDIAPTNYFLKLLCLLISIVVIGIGVYIYLQPKLVPMPAEGLAGAISEVSGRAFGNCKTIVDMSMILVAALLQIILLGGFSSFVDAPVVREGTLLAAFCVGQVVKFIAKTVKKTQAKKEN